ncbi:LysR family transcriptional regulator [Aestuariicella hydrocarbonica]|uniref:LysR family transcriptional regulator n=1 Tax=Pseudomaricurvus hydrocarbonicus TaxID=1470433 RepID=A0A9E5JW38_9GAMM|nr:LysR family transcriptional regulator [Aestuariicella hydrocarbonica]NHO65965.1 LysR family transcriptional regulator [Aestuariicella hydrocarbonica]
MEIDLKKLNHVVTVATTGSFSRAAEVLHITQPALSRSIATVEAHFGIKIFDRSRRGSALTPLGQLAVEEAEKLLRQARTLDHNLQLYRQGKAGKLAFGMGPLIASLTLPKLSSHFMQQHPKLQIHASIKPDLLLHNELKEDQIEMLFCGKGLVEASPEVSFEVVGQIELAMLVRADHPLTTRPSLKQTDLFEFPVLSAIHPFSSATEPVGGAFICDNYDVLRTTVMHSDGIWITSPQLVEAELKQGLLAKIHVKDEQRPSHVEVYMARLRGTHASPAAEAIETYVKDFFSRLAVTQ